MLTQQSPTSPPLALPALPAGADPEHSERWEPDGEGGLYRLVWSPSLGSDDMRVVVTQHDDGVVDEPEVWHGCASWTPAAARAAGMALLAAADLADQWTGAVR